MKNLVVFEQIKNKLDEIEKKENVTILFAVESGSRAWGFESPDSDYDVRFVYKRNDIKDYLKLNGIRDVIEYELNDIYDINGWDIDKTLKLLHSSNPVIFEWVNSPIIYKKTEFLDEFKEFIQPFFMTIKGAHHYLHMAERNYEEYLCADIVKLKKYFYVLRPVLATKYVLKHKTNPPMLFKDLVESELDDSIKPEVEKLLNLKVKTSELGESSKIKILNDYIEKELVLLKNEVNSLKKEEANWEELNRLFYKILDIY